MKMNNIEASGVQLIVKLGVAKTVQEALSKAPMTTGSFTLDGKTYTYNAMVDNAHPEDGLLILTRNINNRLVDMAVRIPLT